MTIDHRAHEKRIDALTKCGKNMGPHDYIPMAWNKKEEYEWVDKLICRVCLCQVNTSTLINLFPDLSIKSPK